MILKSALAVEIMPSSPKTKAIAHRNTNNLLAMKNSLGELTDTIDNSLINQTSAEKIVSRGFVTVGTGKQNLLMK
jgi:hypothetical protein